MSAKNKAFKQKAKINAIQNAQYKYDGEYWENCIIRHELGNWLRQEMFKLLKEINDPYTDNFRWCEIGVNYSEELYRAAQNKGCCGYADKTVVHKSGRKFRIGFNYGH